MAGQKGYAHKGCRDKIMDKLHPYIDFIETQLLEINRRDVTCLLFILCMHTFCPTIPTYLYSLYCLLTLGT